MRISTPAILRDPALSKVMLLAGFSGAAFGLTVPYLTLIARDRGISLQVIGVMAASYLIAQMFLQLPFGALSDRVGRTPLIALGFVVEGVATGGFVFADSAPAFIGLRVVQGVALAMIMPALRALIADVTPMERRGQAYAWLFAAFGGGLMLGPPIGGILASPLGRNPVFLIAATLNVLLGIWTVFNLHAPKPAGQEAGAPRIPYAAMLTRPLIGAFLLGFGSRILEGMFTGIWSIYLDDLGASDFVIGITYSTFSLAFILLTPVGGRLADTGKRWTKILFGNLTMATLIICYGIVQSIPGILVIGLLEGAVATIPTPALDAYLASVADPRIQGRVQGTFATIGTFGAASSALFGVWLYDTAQFLPFAAAGAILITLTLIAVPLVRAAESTVRVAGTPLVAASTVE
jgi:DHA1 family multidrug resistance protein-like MFS transporter